MNEVGLLSQLEELSYDDLLLMIQMLKPYKNSLTLMLDLFKSTEDMIKFLDLFAGQDFKVPPRSRVYFVIFNIRVYNYYMKHKDEPDVLLKTAKMFDVTTQRVSTIVERVSQFK